MSTCKECWGTGTVKSKSLMVRTSKARCPKCKGTGREPQDNNVNWNEGH